MRLAMGTSLGMKMCASRPAAAAYAASAPAALPAEGIASFLSPYRRAMVTHAESPRALNDPVGLSPSSLMKILGYSRLASIGVKPSPSETGEASGRTSLYRHIVAVGPAAFSRRK